MQILQVQASVHPCEKIEESAGANISRTLTLENLKRPLDNPKALRVCSSIVTFFSIRPRSIMKKKEKLGHTDSSYRNGMEKISIFFNKVRKFVN